jgi:hypothetical protein
VMVWDVRQFMGPGLQNWTTWTIAMAF